METSAADDRSETLDDIETLAKERPLFMLRQSKRLRVALKQQEMLNDLQRSFVTMLSHEFRTPLAIMDGAAQKLESRAATIKPEDIVLRAEAIREAIRRLTTRMEKILLSAKYEDGNLPLKFRRCDLREAVVEACRRTGNISPHHRINTNLTDLPEIPGDKEALHQLLDNLLSNAVKYSPNADHVDVRGLQDGDHVKIQVEDYSLGIDEDEVPKLFSRFFRARTAEGIEGTCMGLSLMQKIAEQHGGSVAVESRKGQGSKFIIELPIADRLGAAELGPSLEA